MRQVVPVAADGDEGFTFAPEAAASTYKTSGEFLPWREQLGVTDSCGVLAIYSAHDLAAGTGTGGGCGTIDTQTGGTAHV